MDNTTRELIDRQSAEIRAKLAGTKLLGEKLDINNVHDCIVGAWRLGQTEPLDPLCFVSTPKPLSPPPHEAGSPSTPRPTPPPPPADPPGYIGGKGYTPRPTPPKPEEYVLRQPKPRLGQVTNNYSQSDDRIIWLVVGMTITIISILATLVTYGLLVQYVIR